MKARSSILHAMLVLLIGQSSASAADVRALLASLKDGGYVIVFRHGATDDSQRDVYPFKFDDMKAQRQLSDQGRQTARQIGAAIKQLGIPIGEVYASRLNRGIETGELLSGKQVKGVDGLTDSGAGAASAMANPSGANAKAGSAVRELVNAPPKTGTNTLLVTHKTNFADAFGKDAGDVQEAEAFVYKSNAPNPAKLVGRVKAEEWSNP
jgi:phosphohistidine phosphatase SixA